MKNSFILYTDYMEHLELLNMEQRGVLLTALMCFQMQQKLPEMDSLTQLAFSFISKDMRINNEKYEETIIKRSEAGKLGGRPKKANGFSEKAKKANGFSEKQTKAKKADNDNDNDNVNDNENVNENVNEIKHIYGTYHHVRLKESEIEKLKQELGDYMTEQCITYLDEYIEMKGTKYKSHYLVIKKWVVDAVKEKNKKKPMTDEEKTQAYLKAWEDA